MFADAQLVVVVLTWNGTQTSYIMWLWHELLLQPVKPHRTSQTVIDGTQCRGTARLMKDAKRFILMGEWYQRGEREWHMSPITVLLSTTLSPFSSVKLFFLSFVKFIFLHLSSYGMTHLVFCMYFSKKACQMWLLLFSLRACIWLLQFFWLPFKWSLIF